ncbi:MAG: DMT family transporter [Gemmatimonadaceae bacterium]
MWIAFALLAACGSASTNLVLKRAVGTGGVVVSTVAFRAIAGLLLGLAFTLATTWPTPTDVYWRTLAVAIPFEIGGMLFLTLALRAGDLSAVQPIMGLLPLLVMAGGMLFLHELPSWLAAVGVVLVAVGLYCVGLREGASWMEPVRALAREPANWFAVLAALCWTVTSLLHKIGIAQVGAIPWGATLTFGSALGLACTLPVLVWKTGSIGMPTRVVPWILLVTLAGVCTAMQQFGFFSAMQRAQASYVNAVTSMSILLATAMGVVLLREQGGAHRITGALLVSGGVGLIALFG